MFIPINHTLRRKIGKALSQRQMFSGGKDSMILLNALHGLKQRSPVKFSVSAITLRPGIFPH